ncbi:MAG: aminotransferase class IV [bacterium]|nr:aminotransferase class IV [bacterium]
MNIILQNNKFVKDAKVSALGSIGRGYGVFETLRTHNKVPQQAKEHINRLFHSAKQIDLKPKYSKTRINQQLNKIINKSPHKDQRIKIMALEKDLIIISVPLKIDKKIYKGVSCKSIECTRSLPEVKSISYLSSYLSHERAAKEGYFDAILIDKKKEVYEGAYSNIFWFEENTLCTRKTDILHGITRDQIIKKSPFKIKNKTITIKELKKKKEVFLTNSISGIVPITKIDNKKIGNGKPGEKTKKLSLLFPV